ncbi:hypothetical protein G6F46_010727 [Rhizopus delemar]|uniref:Uncharacterized protein n=2 Tax=Rhizopus TaxID=4842 RepID=A0A9P6YTQ0_9FUNG|nr:hypothetical protein G6F55_010622 [Rhizopus delemar]KAG1535726.1 hypothetical protein G6F51_011373 [Rhizopus arrhizus]KAG1490044.1 hypothetical protein G6F54_011008 [Rhizopus delemar]KAG1501844.1 hypothetical protein G6F53_010993 [Rhizopus delemar]KAG1503831.1 hypothetical protein G6F52_012240 [Rhizopus delemar]
MNTAEIKQVMNKASRYLETRLENQLKKIETEKITQDRINKRSRSIRNLFFDKQIVFSKEDTTAAHILYTLAAFANLLCQQPKLINRLVLVQICSSKIPAHELEAVPEIVRQINQLYGTTEFVPVHFYHQEIDQDELLAFMNAAHIGLCLNASSAKEFALHTTHPLNTTISVQDPSNIPQLTEALQNALVNHLMN